MNKYLVYIFAILAFTVVSCDPMEEVYEELDKDKDSGSDFPANDLTMTLTEDDYDYLSENFDVAGFGNFDSENQAKEFIPKILDQLLLGDGSSVLVTYHIYDPIRINNAPEFTLTADDYDALDQSYGNLSSDGDIIDAVEYKHPNPEEEDLVTITYEYYTGSGTEARTSKVAYYESSWHISYVPTAEDYEFMGQSYPNFESRSTGRERIAVILNDIYRFNEEGDIRTSVFTYTYVDDNDTPDNEDDDFRVFEDFLAVFAFDGEVWVPFQDVQERALQFGKEDGVWVPDNTVKYTLTGSDYSDIAANQDLGDAAARDNLATYGNFNLGNWTNDDIMDAIDFILHERFPDSVVDQKYLVSYDTYPEGGKEVLVILTAEDTYEVVE